MRPDSILISKVEFEISIHASAKDATGRQKRLHRGETISIHASAKDATVTQKEFLAFENDFNPRIREGCDGLFQIRHTWVNNFNPRIREGCDEW